MDAAPARAMGRAAAVCGASEPTGEDMSCCGDASRASRIRLLPEVLYPPTTLLIVHPADTCVISCTPLAREPERRQAVRGLGIAGATRVRAATTAMQMIPMTSIATTYMSPEAKLRYFLRYFSSTSTEQISPDSAGPFTSFDPVGFAILLLPRWSTTFSRKRTGAWSAINRHLKDAGLSTS
jgi:hypothetical protein